MQIYPLVFRYNKRAPSSLRFSWYNSTNIFIVVRENNIAERLKMIRLFGCGCMNCLKLLSKYHVMIAEKYRFLPSCHLFILSVGGNKIMGT